MQIEEGEGDEEEEILQNGCCFCTFCCKKETSNPDFRRRYHSKAGWYVKLPYRETGYLIPCELKEWTNGKTMESLRRGNSATRHLPSPEECILRTNSKKEEVVEFSQPSFDMNVADVNNLLRRRLSLRVLVNEGGDDTGERGEALLPQMSTGTLSEATPILLSHLVKEGGGSGHDVRRRSSVQADMVEKFRSSFSSKAAEDLELFQQTSIEQKSDKEFLDYLMRTSHFMKEALEKDWTKTRNYVRWLDSHVKSPRFDEKSAKLAERWLVVLYTSSEDSHDQLSNFRCMLVRLLLQHHCIVYEERDITLPQFKGEFQERLLGDKLNIPQVFMQGFNIGGYRVMYAIHKMGLSKSIFQRFIIPAQGYAEWMVKKESKSNLLSLDVNLKAFPALQALAGSWSNHKLSAKHLEFVTEGKFVVKFAREQWYQMSSKPYAEPDLRRYSLLRLTIVQAMIAMNKVYKQYLDKIEPEEGSRLRRKLSWLPKFSKSAAKD